MIPTIPAHLAATIANVQRSLEMARRFRKTSRDGIPVLRPLFDPGETVFAWLDDSAIRAASDPGGAR